EPIFVLRDDQQVLLGRAIAEQNRFQIIILPGGRCVRASDEQHLGLRQGGGLANGGSAAWCAASSSPATPASGAAFVCAIVGDGGQPGLRRRFDRGSASAGRVWRHSAAAPVNRQISALLLPPAPSKKSQPPPVSLRLSRGNSWVFFAALPPIREATDLVELTGPEFADIGFTTADLLLAAAARSVDGARRRAPRYARGQRQDVRRVHRASGRDQQLCGNCQYERSGLVQGTLGNRTSPRVLTSFFKLRLVCRHDGVDYDVLAASAGSGQLLPAPQSSPLHQGRGELAGNAASLTASSSACSPRQNSPTGGFRAVCRFRLADAERLLTWRRRLHRAEPAELAPPVARENFRRRSDVSEAVQLLLDAAEDAPAEPPDKKKSAEPAVRQLMASLLLCRCWPRPLTVLAAAGCDRQAADRSDAPDEGARSYGGCETTSLPRCDRAHLLS
uniref:PH domain-containing protein n=1 Tax=Macrostomum lignano TaxID=282301 RepID=A0A1I8JPU6_9PLAT